MVTKLFLRPNTLPLVFFISPKPSFSKLTIPSLFSTTIQTLTPKALPYGPSLQKGKSPFEYSKWKGEQNLISQLCSKLPNSSREEPEQPNEEDPDGDFTIDEEKFTRVFDIAALRVPAKECFALESRIRGHLLNWPRIGNIGRVPGDEMEEEVVSLFGDSNNEEGNLDALERRIYGKAEGDGEVLSTVLYRERLAKEFNSRGFVRFRNLAKISRPKSKKKERRGAEREANRSEGKVELFMLELMEDNEQGEDWRGLLGEGFRGRRQWRGSTRLLLLDERYADKGVENFPQAIKVAKTNSFDTL